MAEMTELRNQLRQAGVQYKVVKNTLARLAAKGTPLEPASGHFTGPVGIAVGFDDAMKVAQGVVRYSDKSEKLKLLAAVVEGSLVEGAEVKAVAGLPPREVLLSMIAGLMAAPLAKMARALSATVAGFGHAMNALTVKKEASG